MEHIVCHPLTFSTLPLPLRLDYQPLLGKWARAPESGGNRAFLPPPSPLPPPPLQKKILRTRGVKFLSPGHVFIRYRVHQSRGTPGGEKGVAHKFPLQISKMISFAYNSENGVNVFWKNILLRNLFYFCKKNCVFTKDSSAMTKFIKTCHSFFLSRSSIFSSLESVVCIFTLFLPFQAVFRIFRERRGEKTRGIGLKTNECSLGKSFLNKHS